MRILWLSNVILPVIAEKLSVASPVVGGWMTGLANELVLNKKIELTVVFPCYTNSKIVYGKINNLSYCGFPQTNINPTLYSSRVESYFKEILLTIKPDIIHIFGTEYPHTLAMVKTCDQMNLLNVTIISLQGLCSIIAGRFMDGVPYSIQRKLTLRDILFKSGFKKQRKALEIRGNYEIDSLKLIKHVMGRTNWDESCTMNINQKVHYYQCNESLRDSFYSYKWDWDNCDKHTIFMSQAGTPNKGLHQVLIALPQILRVFPNTQLIISGYSPIIGDSIINWLKQSAYDRYLDELIKKYNLSQNIIFIGLLDEQQMCEQYLKANVFILPSSIENSPNSLGEAMLLGVPCVTSCVGGVQSLIHDKIEGFLYPFNEPYMLSYYINKIFSSRELSSVLSENARKRAAITHNRKINNHNLLGIYHDIIS